MIVYGTKLISILTESIDEACPNCGNDKSIQMSVFQKYAYIFWIPFFPMGKHTVTECSHCKQALYENEFTSTMLTHSESMKSKGKIPLWTYSGLVLFSIIIIVGIISEKQNDEKNDTLVSKPQVGDIYEVKVAEKQYTLYKVHSITNDTIYVLINNYETNIVTGLDDIKSKGSEAYAVETEPMLLSQLKELHEAGNIINIHRE
jgi:hypothetical protein